MEDISIKNSDDFKKVLIFPRDNEKCQVIVRLKVQEVVFYLQIKDRINIDFHYWD